MQVFAKKIQKNLRISKKSSTFAAAFEMKHGAIAQLVEQRTENPCVPSSILGGTTKDDLTKVVFLFFHKNLAYLQKKLYLCSRFNLHYCGFIQKNRDLAYMRCSVYTFVGAGL